MEELKQKGIFKKNFYLRSFLLGLSLAFIMFIPFIIRDGGRFTFYGDFNVQQIAFYQLAHDAIKSGNIGWSSITDLGANFIGSYSFYLLGSPFFWITLPFPSEAVQYLMGPLLILKFACASLAAYTFLQRYVKNKNIAIVGGLLYAFSGYSLYNVFFNHFHEALIIFPFLLWSIDEYMETRRRGVVAVCIFASCLLNYYFFVGQVMFCLIYFFVRLVAGSYKIKIRDFLLLALETVIGLAMACVLLVPSIFAVLQNYRVNNPIMGWNALVYDRNQRYIHIIQSMFFPPDLPARPNFTPDSGSKWASLGAWLPLFGMTGVITWLQLRRKHWLKKVLAILFICTLVPCLNSAFQLFNSSYYARWFYMLTLMTSLATVMSIEDVKVNWKRAIKWTTGISVAIVVAIGFMPYETKVDDVETIKFGLEEYPTRFWSYAAIVLVCTAILVYLFRFAKKETFQKRLIAITSAVCVLYGMFFLALGKTQTADPYDHLIPYALNGGKDINLYKTDVARSDFYESMDNSAMFWQIPSIQAFHSIVPGSIMKFYDYIGVTRDVGSRPGVEHYALRGLTSVKWLFDQNNNDDYFGGENYDTPLIVGFNFYGTANGFDIWENEYYIPMGFTYNYFITETQAEEISETHRANAMLQAAIIPDEDEFVWSQYASKLDVNSLRYSEDEYIMNCQELAMTSCTEFKYSNTGFTAKTSVNKEKVVFFSVPFENGWTAFVNGEETEILKTNVGFMSVVVPKGDNVKIEFKYETPGLKLGILISISALVLLFIYIYIGKQINKKDALKRSRLRKRKVGSFKKYCEDMKINLPEKA